MVRAESVSDNTAPAGIIAAIPVMAVVFLFFASVGMTLPVLPLHVHDVLRFGPAIVGLLAGAQFIDALGSRFWAGSLADTKGPKYAMLLGLVGAAAGSLCYLGSLTILAAPVWSATLLVVGRGLLGGAESLVITGGMLWGLGLVAPDRSAKIIALVGMSMFAAMAIGAPIGAIIYAHLAFAGIAGVTLLLSFASLAVIARLRPYVPAPGPKGRWTEVLGAVVWPGIGFALSGITFGAVTAFLTLYFALRGWGNGPIAFTIFAGALIVTRLIAGELPDRYGGARVAAWSLVVQVAGLAMIGTAGSELIAMVGALVAGAGFSLVFPSLGLEAVQRAPAKNRGLAMGTYNAFLDLTLGLGSPALGWLGDTAGLGSVFVASAVAALLAIPIAIGLQRTVRPTTYAHPLERKA